MEPSEERRGPTPTTSSEEEIDRLRLRYGFWIIITGFALVAFITIVSIYRWAEVTSVATVVGAVASLMGIVVGAFFGVQVGALWARRGRRLPVSARKRRLGRRCRCYRLRPPNSYDRR